MDKNFFSKKAIQTAKEKGIFSELAKLNPEQCTDYNVDVQSYIVENFSLEYEAQRNSFIRWFKQTQPNHDDYVFKITIETIKKDSNEAI